MAKQVYFVVYYDEETGEFYSDGDRAEAVFNGDDVWDDSDNDDDNWENVLDNEELYSVACKKLNDLFTGKNGGN